MAALPAFLDQDFDLARFGEVVINGNVPLSDAGDGMTFNANRYSFGWHFASKKAYCTWYRDGYRTSSILVSKIHLAEEDHWRLFCEVIKAASEVIFHRRTRHVVMHYMTTDEGLQTYYQTRDAVGISRLAHVSGWLIVATVNPIVLPSNL